MGGPLFGPGGPSLPLPVFPNPVLPMFHGAVAVFAGFPLFQPDALMVVSTVGDGAGNEYCGRLASVSSQSTFAQGLLVTPLPLGGKPSEKEPDGIGRMSTLLGAKRLFDSCPEPS